MFTLFLMTSKGFNVLKHIIHIGHAILIDKVIVGEDKNVLNDYSAEIYNLCGEYGIQAEPRSNFESYNTRYALAISWRWIIPISPIHKLIVLHDSLLPKYRGFSPLVSQLINGEKKIGVTALYASENYDEGNIIYQSSSNIDYPITISEAIEIINKNYIETTAWIFNHASKNIPLPSLPQPHDLATYSLWRDDEDYRINWQDTASRIERFINAVGFPYKGAQCLLNGKVIQIKKAIAVNDVFIENRDVGKVLFVKNNKPVIVCGKGLLLIEKAIYLDGESIIPMKKFRSRFS